MSDPSMLLTIALPERVVQQLKDRERAAEEVPVSWYAAERDLCDGERA